jgi:hypothetical protein
MDTAQGMPADVSVVSDGDGDVAVAAAKIPDRAPGGWP